MDRLIYTAMSGASQTMGRLASVAHNLANVSTTGYRAEEHRLRAVQVQTKSQTSLPTRAFTVDASTHTDFSAGPMLQTGNQFDVAVQGDGWLALSMPDGTEAYTRNGNLQLDTNGVLQTRSGIPVQGDGGVISIPPDQKVEIGRDGTVSIVPQTGAQTTSSIGRVKLVNPSTSDLVRGEDGLFRLKSGQAAPLDENVRVATGYLEGSNVSPVDQMVNMISLSRQFDLQLKLVESADTNDQAATKILTVS